MKRLDLVAPVLAVAAISMLVAATATAQDPVKVAPDIYKLVYENDRVRVLEITIPPGGKIGKHSHPDHFGYVLGPGKLRISKSDTEAMEADFTLGQVVWIPAETHWGENIGETEIRVLVTELKEPAPKAKAKAKAAKVAK